MKKITMFGVVAALLLVVTAVSASALSVSPAQLTIGGTSQSASNSRSIDNAYKNVLVTGTVTITNDGTETINSLRLGTIVPKLGFQATDLNVTVTFAATTLAVNASTTATITSRVPEKLDSVTSSSLAEAAFNVADFTILGTGATTGSTASTTDQLFLQRQNQLRIKEVEICVNDNCKTVRDGGNVENLRPGDTIDMKIIVENRYSSSDREDLDIDDAELEYSIDDSDFDESDRSSLSTIGSDSETEESFSFSINDDVRDGSYTLDVKVYGRDELGAYHGDHSEIRLKVTRDTHDLQIRRATVSPGTFACDQKGKTARATISVTNIGKRDEAKVALEVFSSELGIKERLENLRMDQDNSRTENIAFNIPDSAKPGTYQLTVKSFFDLTAQSDAIQVPLVIADCSAGTTSTTSSTTSSTGTSSTTSGTSSTTSIQQSQADAELIARLAALQNQVESLKSQQQQATTVQTVPVTTRSTTNEPVRSTALPWVAGFANSGLYIALLSGVIVLVIIVLIALIVKFLAPRA